MKLNEITDDNIFTINMYGINFKTNYSFNLATQLFNDIMQRKDINYTNIHFPYFEILKNGIIDFISLKDNSLDLGDQDLIKLYT
jgi:hypothetical protein